MARSTRLKKRPRAFNGSISAFIIIAAVLLPLAPSCRTKREPIRVGVIGNLSYFDSTFDGFKARLTELGYREGKEIRYDYTLASSTVSKEALEKFVDAKVDLIFAFPTEAALAAKRAGSDAGISVLFANSNIEGVELVDSILSPGKGITGVRYPGPDITVKRFEILSRIAPTAKRFLLPYRSDVGIIPAQLAALAPVAAAAGATIQARPFKDAAEVSAFVASLPESGATPFDAVLMAAEPLMVTKESFSAIAAYAAKRRLPIGGAIMEADGYASIFGVSTDNIAVGRQAAGLARKIFTGTEPGAIPVVSAEYFIEIDLGAAAKAGIAIPESLIKRADRIIK
jgi:putative tryptophan/tyrosine transport system substrate-binding protein